MFLLSTDVLICFINGTYSWPYHWLHHVSSSCCTALPRSTLTREEYCIQQKQTGFEIRTQIFCFRNRCPILFRLNPWVAQNFQPDISWRSQRVTKYNEWDRCHCRLIRSHSKFLIDSISLFGSRSKQCFVWIAKQNNKTWFEGWVLPPPEPTSNGRCIRLFQITPLQNKSEVTVYFFSFHFSFPFTQ